MQAHGRGVCVTLDDLTCSLVLVGFHASVVAVGWAWLRGIRAHTVFSPLRPPAISSSPHHPTRTNAAGPTMAWLNSAARAAVDQVHRESGFGGAGCVRCMDTRARVLVTVWAQQPEVGKGQRGGSSLRSQGNRSPGAHLRAQVEGAEAHAGGAATAKPKPKHTKRGKKPDRTPNLTQGCEGARSGGAASNLQ